MTLFVVSVFGLAVGCDPVGSDMQATLDALRLAEHGFVAGNYESSVDSPAELEKYRQSVLDQAVADLDKVIQSGTPAQKVAARRLTADIHASAARYEARQATSQYAALAAQSGAMLGQLFSADRSAARGALFTQDQPDLGRLEAIAVEHKARKQELTPQADELAQQRAAGQAKIDARRLAATAQNAQRYSLSEQAFVAQGDAKFNLLEQAAAAERDADIADVQAAKHQVGVDALDRKRAVVHTQLEVASALLDDLANRMDEARQRQQDIAASVTDAEAARDQAMADLAETFRQIDKIYQEQVEQPLAAAAQKIEDAVTLLTAAPQPDRSQAKWVEFDLLGARMEQVHILTDHAIIASGYGGLVSVLAAASGGLGSEHAALFDSRREQITAGQQDLIKRAKAAAAAAGAEAGSDPHQRLQDYLGRLEQVALK